ncbi:MAG: bifunctional diguanylate cyclase/phosphodiesterase [Gammaproteobacteria bacterium]
MRRYTTGLRGRLLLLVLLAVVPAFALMFYTAVRDQHRAARNAEHQALGVVRLAAAEQNQLIAATRQLLITFSQLPVLKPASSAAACHQTLAALREPYPYYANFGVATPDGQMYCSALPLSHPVNIADRRYFRHALRSRGFGIGDYQVGRITGSSAINFGYPIFDSKGRVEAVVFAAVNLSWLRRLIIGTALPAGSVVTVTDSQGTVLAAYPKAAREVGRSIRGSALFDAILAHPDIGLAKVVGPEGILRLYAFAPLRDSSSRSAYVSVGIPEAVAFAGARKDFVRGIALLLLAVILALLSAWVGSVLFVLRPVNLLSAAARRLGAGDLGARTGLSHGPGELGQLARSFDDMASALQRVHRARKTLSAGNRIMVRATDEQSLLVEMCRIIVEVGVYPCAWVGYVEHDQEKTVRLVAQAGFEGGLAALASSIRVSWGNSDHGHGPAGMAIRSGLPCVAQNIVTDRRFAPWREMFTRCGYAAAGAFPLHGDGQVLGILVIYSMSADAFDEEEMDLLAEAAQDLAFGIATLRTRANHDRAHETIRHMAYYDQLTGLANHINLQERLQQILRAPDTGRSPLALLLVGIDRLREINDALGFDQGDLVLKKVGERLCSVMAESEMIARLRGDEFAVLLPGRDAAYAVQAALRILDALDAPLALSDLVLSVSAAVGITLAPEHGTEATHLIRNGDIAMNQAKKLGSRHAFYDPAQGKDSRQRLALASELRRAIEEGQMTLYYQPKVGFKTGMVCGAEALIRWFHPRRGMIPPDEFIPLAEQTGLINPLTDWVLGEVARQTAVWRAAGLGIAVAANLSARNLRDPALVDKVRRLSAAHNAGAGWLELEVTESAIMDDPDTAWDILVRLSDMGIALFIDDFGTGYSSLGYLRKLPVDAVKIDKSFVLEMLTNADSEAIVRSTIDLAHDLGLKVVAEGVEDQATWDRLVDFGCDVAQGYHISRPLPDEQFAAWLRDAGLATDVPRG